MCQGVGTGKTTEMLEIGHLHALHLLGKKAEAKISVRLVVMTTELVEYYCKIFAEKQAACSAMHETAPGMYTCNDMTIA